MHSFGTTRHAAPCLSTRTRSDRHFLEFPGACAREGVWGGYHYVVQPRRYRVPGQPLLNRHQMGVVSRSPDGLFAQQEREPIRGRPAVRGKWADGGRPGQRVEVQGTWALRTQKHSEAGNGRPVDRGAWTATTVKRPRQQPAHPQYANYWAPLTRKQHTMPHSAQPRDTNYWAPRTRKRHQQEHRPERPTENNDPTQHVKGRKEHQPDGMSQRGGVNCHDIWGEISMGGGGVCQKQRSQARVVLDRTHRCHPPVHVLQWTNSEQRRRRQPPSCARSRSSSWRTRRRPDVRPERHRGVARNPRHLPTDRRAPRADGPHREHCAAPRDRGVAGAGRGARAPPPSR